MKKYILLLALAFITALYGCAEEKEEAQPLIQPDLSNPDTLVGSYDISYFSIQDENQIITDNCTIAENGAPTYNNLENSCEQITDLISHRIGIQKNWDVYRNVYSVVIQLQLNSQKITQGELQNTAYRHIIFPIQESYFPNNFGVDAVSKATDRGLSSYYVEPPYGNRTNTNSYVQSMKMEDDKLVFSLKTKDGKKTYIFKLQKVSNDSGNYVIKYDVEYPQGGLYARSVIRNNPLVTIFEDTTLTELYKQYFAIFE